MSRWEDADVSGLDLPPPDKAEEVFFGTGGKATGPDQALAKSVTSNVGVVFYIKYGRGELIDPYNADSFRNHNGPLFKFKKVCQKSFDAYITYLTGKNRWYFTQARRLTMENFK